MQIGVGVPVSDMPELFRRDANPGGSELQQANFEHNSMSWLFV